MAPRSANMAALVAVALLGCVDEHRVQLPRFAPRAAVLLVVERIPAPLVYAFQADADGLAHLPAFTASENDVISLIEYGCSLESLELDAEWQRSEKRALPDSPTAAYRLVAGKDGDRFEPFSYFFADFSEVTLPGVARDECLNIEPTLKLELDIDRPAAVPIAIELGDGALLIHAFGVHEDSLYTRTFRISKEHNISELPLFPRFGYAALVREEDAVVVDSGSRIHVGPIEGPYTVTATLANAPIIHAWIDRAPNDRALWIVTSRPGFYRLDGDVVTTLREPAELCDDDCDDGGVLAQTSTEVYAVLNGELEITRWTNGATMGEPLDSIRYNVPTRIAPWKKHEPLVGSHLGAIFDRVNGRWNAIAVSLIRDINLIVPIPGGILFTQNRGVVNEFQFRTERNCDPPRTVPTNQIFAMFLAGDELVVIYRDENDRIQVTYNPIERKLNRCMP